MKSKIIKWLGSLLHYLVKIIRSISLRKRLFILSTVLIIFPNITISLNAYKKAVSIINNDMRERAFTHVRGVSGIINERLREYSDLSNQIVSNETLRDYLFRFNSSKSRGDYEQAEYYQKLINDYLYHVGEEKEYLLNVQIVTEHYEFNQTSIDGKNKGAKISNIDQFRASKEYIEATQSGGRLIWSDYNISQDMFISRQFPNKDIFLEDNILLLRSIPYSWDNNLLGVIVMNVSSRLFLDQVIPTDMSNERLILCSPDRVVSILNENVITPFKDRHVIKKMISEEKNSAVEKVDSKDCLISMKKLDNADWYVVSIIPIHSLVSPIWDMGKFILLVSGVCIIITIIAALLVMMSVSFPLKNLLKTMELVGNDNEIIVRYQDDALDEIAMIGKSYNNMADRIEHLIKTVYQERLVKKDAELRQKEAQLNALQMQINPHFIYNMLDIIRWKVLELENGTGKISEMIENFSDLLRISTKGVDKLIPIEEEMEYIQSYILIIKTLFEREIDCKINIDNDCLKCRILRLLIQPLIENAILHGFRGKTQNASIEIISYKQEDNIIIKVKDNGKGIDSETLAILKQSLNEGTKINNKYIGLHNVNERIKLAFGEDYGIDIKSELDQYTIVEICIPVIKDDRDIKSRWNEDVYDTHRG